MKRILLGAVSLLLVFALTACSAVDSADTSDTTTTDESISTTSAEMSENPGTETTASAEPTDPAASAAPTTSDTPADKPQIGSGSLDGLFPSGIWDKVMGNLADSTGMDVSVVSKSEISIGGALSTQEQNVHILLNANSDSYSYAMETETKQTLSGFTYTEQGYQAYQDGWFYQWSSTDESGSPVESAAKIAMTREDLAEQGLDPETILAINAMVGMGMLTFDGQELEALFNEVETVRLSDGRSQIVCKGLRMDTFSEILTGLLGMPGGGDTESMSALLAMLAPLLSCDMELTLSATGMPESLHTKVSMEMTEQMPVSLTSDYTMTVNAIGANAGKVTIPDGADAYPEYADFEEYLEAVAGN